MEIERKFLIDEPKDIPFKLEEHTGEYIQQGYLAVTGKIEIRLRQQGEKTTLTCKSIGGTIREEYEIQISEQQFQNLWPMTSDARIEKTRFVLPLEEDLEVELDVFAGRLTGLMIAEVEFTTEQRCRSFLPPSWFGQEVSNDPSYRCHALASLASFGKQRRSTEGLLKKGDTER